MTYQIKCPACSHLLYFSEGQDNVEDVECICTQCKHKYTLLVATAISFSSSLEIGTQTRYGEQPSYSRTYNLRLQQTNKALKPLQFSTTGQLEKITIIAGDEILLLYVMQGTKLKDLLWLENCTTGRKLQLLHLGAKSLSKGVGSGVLSLIASISLAGALRIPLNQVFVVAMPGSIGVGMYVIKRSSLKVRDRLELERLSLEQQLLAQKHDLEQKVTQLTQELKTNSSIVNRLEALQQKMSNANADMYARRITTVVSGISVIEEQLDLIQKLVNGYSQLLEIIEIEYETSRLAEKLPSDISSQVLSRLEELRVVEERKQELSLQIKPQTLLSEV